MSVENDAGRHPSIETKIDDDTEDIVLEYDTRLKGGLEATKEYVKKLHDMGFGSKIDSYHTIRLNEDYEDQVTIRF